MATVDTLPDGERGIQVELEEVEVALVRSLAAQVIDFVGPRVDEDADPLVAIVGIDPEATTPEDPALRRLLPDAYADDPDAPCRDCDLRAVCRGGCKVVSLHLEGRIGADPECPRVRRARGGA